MEKINHQMDIIQILKQFRKNALLVTGLTKGYQRKFSQVVSQQVLSDYSTPTASSGEDGKSSKRSQRDTTRRLTPEPGTVLEKKPTISLDKNLM